MYTYVIGIGSGIFQRMFTFQWHVPKDCHFPSGLSLEFPNGCSVAFSHESSLVHICFYSSMYHAML